MGKLPEPTEEGSETAAGGALDWEQARARLRTLPPGATVLLVGATDTGKTTFVREAVGALTGAGKTVAVLDCDLGQSEVGPPATVGVALAGPGGSGGRSLRDLAPLAAYFVGATSPSRHLLDVCVGACQVARAAKKRRPDLLLVDTDGLVGGRAGVQLKRRLAELLLPHAVLAFARGPELDPLLAAFAGLKAPEVWRVAVPPAAGRKTSAARATRRAARFLAALDGAQEVVVSWGDVALVGTTLGLGTPLAPHLRRWLGEALRLPVLHAEQGADGTLYAVVNGERRDPAGLAAIERQFQTAAVTVAPAQRFAGLLVGLVGTTGALLDLGLIRRIDFDRRTLTLHTPCRRPAAVAQVWLGALRLRPDGRELGETRPGEV